LRRKTNSHLYRQKWQKPAQLAPPPANNAEILSKKNPHTIYFANNVEIPSKKKTVTPKKSPIQKCPASDIEIPPKESTKVCGTKLNGTKKKYSTKKSNAKPKRGRVERYVNAHICMYMYA